MTMKPFFEAAGIPWGQQGPEQEFRQYATQAFRPGPSQLRSAFYDIAEPLLQSYYLSQPSMPGYGGFADFMGQATASPTFFPGADAQLRNRAEQAAFMARMPGAQFFQYVDPQEGYAGPAITPEMQTQFAAMSPAQQLLYRQTYGTGEEAAANQAQLVNLLALQRGGGGGFYGGPVGQAITGALGEMRGQLIARNPESNFLDWYLERTQNGQGLGGFLRAPTPAGTQGVGTSSPGQSYPIGALQGMQLGMENVV